MESLDYQTLLVAGLAVIGLLWLIMNLAYRSKMKILDERNSYLTSSMSKITAGLVQEKALNNELKERNQGQREQMARYEANLDNIRTKYEELLYDDEGKLQKFENLANRVLKQQSSVLNERQAKGMKDILDPLKEKIKSFEEKVDLTSKEYIKGQTSMKEQIFHLAQQSEKVSRDANNLAKALKGDFKKQGNWGELILESILDKSGLEKGREYFIQVSERSHDGNLRKPDVVIQLPDGKKMIIDSKVSLVAYDSAFSTDNEEEMNSHLLAHSVAMKKHIDELSMKNYHDLYEMASPDFVLMFVPIDSAFSAALRHNNDLYQYGYSKNIVIVTPSTLLATLKTVETLWKNEKYNANALEIATEAGRMYDKFVGFVSDLSKLGVQLNTVNSTYTASMNKLKQGTGNLIKRAERLRTLGAKTNKSLDATIIEQGINEDAN